MKLFEPTTRVLCWILEYVFIYLIDSMIEFSFMFEIIIISSCYNFRFFLLLMKSSHSQCFLFHEHFENVMRIPLKSTLYAYSKRTFTRNAHIGTLLLCTPLLPHVAVARSHFNFVGTSYIVAFFSEHCSSHFYPLRHVSTIIWIGGRMNLPPIQMISYIPFHRNEKKKSSEKIPDVTCANKIEMRALTATFPRRRVHKSKFPLFRSG